MLGLAAVALQCIEYTVQHFGPTDGAFASVFCAWTAFYLIAVLGTMYWLETQVATELRARRAPAHAHGRHQGPRPADRARARRRASSTGPSSPAIGVLTYVVAVPALMLAAATATPGFWDWSLDPPLVLVIVLAILYWLGDRRTVTPAARARRAPLAERVCFYAGARGARDRAQLAARRRSASSCSGRTWSSTCC